jgi:hypothetical protein
MTGLLGAISFAATVGPGQLVAQPKKGKEKGAIDKKPAPRIMPDDGVLVIARSLTEAGDKEPDAVLVAPWKWAAIQDELARLRAEVERKKGAQATPPTKCVLKGKVEGRLVSLQAQFEFFTHAPNTTIYLACGLAHAWGVSLDGRTPQLLGGGRLASGAPEGFSVQVEKTGEHQLTLDLMLPLTARTGGQGLLLDLPRASVTRLELELPAGARDVRAGNRPLPETLELKGRQLNGTLGAADKLELSWRSAAASAGPAPVLTVKGLVQVRLAGNLTTDAQLTLESKGGAFPSPCRLIVPLKAEVKVAPADEGRVKIEPFKAKDGARAFTVRLKEASDAPLTLYVHVQSPAPAAGASAGIGPFTVLEATQQSGTVLVSNAAPDLHLDYQPRGDLRRRPLEAEEQRRDQFLVAAFDYGPKSGLGKVAEKNVGPVWSASTSPWLDIEPEPVRGQIIRNMRVKHALTLRAGGTDEGGAPAGPHWHLKTVLTGTPRWADVSRLVIHMPAGCELVEGSASPLPEGVRQVVYDRAARRVEVRLSRSGIAPPKELNLSFEAIYPPAEGAAPSLQEGKATLELPRPVGAVEGGEVVVRAPHNVQLLVPKEGGPPGAAPGWLELVQQGPHELKWQSERRAPERIDVAWERWRAKVHVWALIDLELTGSTGQVRRHELRLRSPQSPLTQIGLRVPAAVADSLRILQGGRLTGEAGEPAKGGMRIRWAQLNAPPAGEEHVLVLAYDFSLGKPAGGSGAQVVPLVVPADALGAAVQGDTKVRVWAEPGTLPVLANSDKTWKEQSIEEVKGTDRLPALVLRPEQRVEAPLKLRFGETAAVYTVLIERALVQATVGEGGAQSYRARYLLSRLAGRHLDIDFPAPVSTLELRIGLDGKRVAWETVDEKGRPNDGGRTARLRLAPELVRHRAVLEVSYQLAPGRTGGGPLRTALQAPVLRDHPGGAPTRWQVLLPPGWVLLGPQAGGPGTERTWGWRGWLLAPRLALTSTDLGRWFSGPTTEGAESSSENEVVPSLVSWREDDGPLVVTHVPQQAWLLVCSLAVLVLGLVLSWLTWPSEGRALAVAWLWPALAALALVLVVCALLWPTVMAQVAYGCQPGALVLVVVAGAQWLLHERYRRQVIFLPSFSRTRSSTQRREAEAARAGEPSTVDVPRPAGSSASSRAKEEGGSGPR